MAAATPCSPSTPSDGAPGWPYSATSRRPGNSTRPPPGSSTGGSCRATSAAGGLGQGRQAAAVRRHLRRGRGRAQQGGGEQHRDGDDPRPAAHRTTVAVRRRRRRAGRAVPAAERLCGWHRVRVPHLMLGWRIALLCAIALLLASGTSVAAEAAGPTGPGRGRGRPGGRRRARPVRVLAAGRDAGPPQRRRRGGARPGHPADRVDLAHRHRARDPEPGPRALAAHPGLQRVLRLRALQRADPVPRVDLHASTARPTRRCG